MTELSPAAQSVLDAAVTSAIQNLHGTYERDIAAALRAAADRVIEEVSPVEAILAIAAELDGTQSTNKRRLQPMTKLSPAAQAVLDDVCCNTEPDCDTQHLIAAALCAVLNQLKHEFPLCPEYTEWDSGHDAGIKRVTNKILSIANELVGIQPTSGGDFNG